MSLTNKGQVTFNGIGAGTITYPALVAKGKHGMESVDVTDQADVSPLNDQNGEVVGFCYRNQGKSITIDAYPTSSDTPGANADMLKALVLPTKGSVVTLASFSDADLNGEWLYQQGARKSYSSEGRTKITIPLTKWEHIPSASLAAAVS